MKNITVIDNADIRNLIVSLFLFLNLQSSLLIRFIFNLRNVPAQR